MKKIPPAFPIPPPQAPPPRLAADVVASGLPVHPEDRVELFGDKQWELFIHGWVDSLRDEYELVERCGGAGDMGRDVIATGNETMFVSELVARKLGESGWSLYASDAYLARHPEPIELADLRGHELIGYDASLEAVPASGAGIAALRCGLGDDEPGLRRLTPEVIAARPVSLGYRREAKLSDQVRAVIDFVIGVMQEAAPRMGGPKPAP